MDEQKLIEVMKVDGAAGERVPNDFDWGSLGEQWWRDAGAACKPVKASELQIRFACAKHLIASNVGAARLAGYKGDEDSLRQAGYRAFKSNNVQTMLALADAEDKPSAPKILDRTARAQMLSKLAEESPDPTTKLRAVEGLNRMDERDSELGRAADQDGFSEWRMVRDYLQLPGGGAAIVSLWAGRSGCLSNLPLLHDVYQAVMREAPELWERTVIRSSPTDRVSLQRHLDAPDWQLEARIQLWREIGVEIVPPGEASPNTTHMKHNGTNAENVLP